MHKYISFRFGKLFHSWNGREKMARSSVIGGRSGIIWILIFMIPVVFTSMIHDSYKKFLPDSWFTKTFDDIFIKWISQRLLCLVLHSFFGMFKLLFSSRIIWISWPLFLCIIICSVQIWCFLLLNINHQCHWRNKRTIIPECTNYIGGSGGMSPRKK